VLRLDELRVSHKDCGLRLSEGGRIVSTVGETTIGQLESENGSLSLKVEKHGVEGQP
jgi:hypothetical protein